MICPYVNFRRNVPTVSTRAFRDLKYAKFQESSSAMLAKARSAINPTGFYNQDYQ